MFNLPLGSNAIDIFGGFFNVPAQAPTHGQPFYGYSENHCPSIARLVSTCNLQMILKVNSRKT